MTKFWGPLGWMTLHSVSVIYPEYPSPEEKAIARKFVDLFASTITCRYCKEHFAKMYSVYLSDHPEMFASRFELVKFAILAHNTVNARLDKPRPSSVKDCLETLVSNTKNVSTSQFRTNYIAYLIKNWSRERTGDGAIFKMQSREMEKINNEYWTPRDTGFEGLSFPEFDVRVPIENVNSKPKILGIPKSGIVGFKGGRLSLIRR